MKSLYCLSISALLVICLVSHAHGADGPLKPGDLKETPNPIRLFIDQWSSYSLLPSGFTLEFIRTAEEETAAITLREAVLIALDNNPAIMVDRLEPFRTAEETIGEKSIFDPTLALEFNK